MPSDRTRYFPEKSVRYCQKFHENLRGKYETTERKPWDASKDMNGIIAAKRRKRRKKIKILFVHFAHLRAKKEKIFEST